MLLVLLTGGHREQLDELLNSVSETTDFLLDAWTRALLPNRVLIPVRIVFHFQIVNQSRSEVGVVPTENLTCPRLPVCCLSQSRRVWDSPLSGPLHLYLLSECEFDEMKQLDKLPDLSASKTSTKDGRDFPPGVVGNPVSRHEPGCPSTQCFAVHFPTLSRSPCNSPT